MSNDVAVKLEIALPGLESLSVGLSRLRTDIEDWTKFWTERFAPFFYTWVQQDFVLEGGNSGATWAALSPAYAAWKQKHYPGRGILFLSGALKTSLSGPQAPGAIFKTSPTELEIGSAISYGIYHQNPRPGTRPQRPPLRVNAAFMKVVAKDMQKFVQSAWAERRKEFVQDVRDGIGAGIR